jgi:hypothetical protein
MGDLVVGNYDLSPGLPGGVISGNAFIYNITTHRWTLLELGGSLSSLTTLYGIWQDGGPRSREYTLAGGSSAHGSSPHGIQRAFLMNYNERTGIFGKPVYYNYNDDPSAITHFEGITKVQGGFNVVAGSSAEPSSMAFIPTTGGSNPSFGGATWYPIDVAGSSLCSAGCVATSGNTVYGNSVAGAYIPGKPNPAGTYIAAVSVP